MNKFFKRLALLLAVLMIVSMMPVQLFADNSIAGEGQSNGTGEASGNSNAVATVNGVGYTSLADAIAAATPDANGVITYEISGKATVDSTGWIQVARAGLTGLTKVEFVGKTSDAEICITGGLAILADQNYDIDVSFEALTLSKLNPTYGGDYGHSTNYFTTWLRNTNAAENTVTYTNCTFPNGACNNQYGKTVVDGCTFSNTTAKLYNFWNYSNVLDGETTGVANTEIKNSTFTGVRGIKIYSEKTHGGEVLVSNTTFDGLTEKAAIVTSKPVAVTVKNVSVSGDKGFFTRDITGNDEVMLKVAGTGISGIFNITSDTNAEAAKEEFNISAGTFTSEVSSDYLADGFELKKNTDDTYGVKAVSVAKIGTVEYASLDDAIKAAKDGDVIVVSAGEYKLNGSLTYTGKAFTIKAADGAKVSFDMSAAVALHGAKITFEGVTFDYKTNGNYIGLQHADTLVYNNCTINGMVFLYATNETFNGCTFNQTSAGAYNVWTYGAKNVKFNGCTFNCVGKSVLLYNENKDHSTNLTVADTTFTASAPVAGKAAIEIDTSLMSGANVTVDKATADKTKGFATGSNSGNSLWNDKKQTADTNKNTTVVVDGNIEFAPKPKPVATVGGVEYTTLADALAAANAGDTVTLTADINTPETSYYIQKSLTIDLGGKTLTGSGYDGVFNIEGENAAVLIKNGKIVAVEQTGTAGKYTMAVWACAAGCAVTLEDLDVSQQITHTDDKQMDMIYTSKGTIIINSGRFESGTPAWTLNCNDSAYKAGTAKIIVNGGTFVGYDPRNNKAEGEGTSFVAPGVGVDAADGSFTAKAGMTAQVMDAKGASVKAFATLAEAIAAAKKNNIVKLLADTKENVTISTPYVTLDLNGHTLNGGTEKGKPALTVTARVTVMDSSAAQTGTIMREDTEENSGVSSHYVIDIQGSGWLTFESGTVKNGSGAGGTKGASLVRVGDDSVAKYPGLNIKGGTFTQDNFIVIKVDRGDLFLNGGELNSANSYAVENWHRATIKGGTVNGTAAAWTYSGGHNSTLEISGGTVNGNVESISYDGSTGKTASVSITGGTVKGELGTYTYSNGLTATEDATKATIGITGGTFANDPSKYVVEGSAITANDDGTFGVAKAYLAQVGENKYYTMDEAFKAQTTSGEPIVMLRDYTTGSTFNSGTVARVVDLNGHTWTCTGTDANSAAFEINNANASLTVKNGKIVSSQLVGLIPSAMGGTIKYDNSSLTFENVEMSTTATSGIETNGNNTNDTVTLKNSTLNVPNGFGIYFPSSGTLTVENSKITAKTMGVQVCSGVLIISGADTAITVTGDAVEKTENDGAIQDGAAISIVNRTGYKGLDTVTVSGGKFTAKEGNSAIKAYDWVNNTESDFTADKGTVAVSGGTFSSAVPADLCAEGFIPTKNADGTYGVKTGKYVAQIGDVKYATLADAFVAAKDGDTIKLLDNVDLTETLIIKDKTITLDLNGKTISNSTDIWNESTYSWSLISVRDNGDLTIDDTVGGGTLKAKENDCFTLDVYAYDTKNVENTKLTVNAGNYIGNISAVYAFTGKVTINGGHFSIQQKESGSDPYRLTLNCYDSSYTAGRAGFTVNGGTFENFDPRNNPAEGTGTSFVAEGVGIDKNADGTFTAKSGMAAQIVDADGNSVAAYAGHYDAIAAAKDGEKVILLSDRKNFVTNTINANITIDLNGKTLSLGNNNPFFRTNGEVTIQNGTIDTKSTYACVIVNAYNKLTLKNVKITGVTDGNGKSLVNVCSNAEVTIDKDTVLTAIGSGVAVFIGQDADAKYTLNVYGKVIQESKSFAICGNGSYKGTTTINIYDGAEVRSASAAIYHPQAGEINVYGGLVEGYCAIAMKSGTLNISGGTVRGTANDHVLNDSHSTSGGANYDGSAIIVDSRSAGYAGNVNINVTGGTVESYYSTAIREIGEQGKTDMTQLTKLNVIGGSVLGASKNPVNVTSDMLVRDISVINISVSGGTFKHAIPDSYCADGFIPTQNDDGTYGVKEAMKGSEKNPYTLKELSEMTRAEYIAAQEALGCTMYVEIGNYSYDKDGVLGNGVRNDTPGQMPDHSKLNAYAENGYLGAKNDGANGKNIIFVGGSITSGVKGYTSIDNIGTSLLLAVPAYTNVTFEGVTFNNVMSFDYQLYTSPWSQLGELKFSGCTFNGIIVGAIAAQTLTFNKCTFTNYTNKDSENNSNPTWIRPAYGNWKQGDNEGQGSDFRSLTTINFTGNTVTSTRPVKFERIAQWEMETKVTVTGNKFDIKSDGSSKNVGLYFGANAKFDLVVDNNKKTDGTAALYTAVYKAPNGTDYEGLPAGSTVKDSNGADVEVAGVIWKSTDALTLKTTTEAVEVGGVKFATLEEAVAAAKNGDTITLLEDCKSDRINLEDKSVTVVLNGKTLTSTAAYGVMFCAKNGNKITIDGTVEGSKLVGTLMITSGTDGHIEVNGGTYESNQYCPIYVNGAVNSENSTVTVKNAIIKATNISSKKDDSGCAVYLAGYSTSVFENCTITAPITGIEIRAGKLTLNNCDVTGGNGEVTADANGNGTTVTNAALAISQHTTKKPIDVTIDGGTFNGKAAVYQTDVQGTGSANVKIAVKSGTFNGTISGETDGTIAISGGKFKVKVDDKYFADKLACSATPNADGYYTVMAHPITGIGLSIGEDISLRVIVRNGYQDGKLFYSYIDANGNLVEEKATIGKDTKGNYVFRIYNINPQRAGTIYTLRYEDKAGNTVGALKEASILTYLEGLYNKKIENETATKEAARKVYIANFLEYCAAAATRAYPDDKSRTQVIRDLMNKLGLEVTHFTLDEDHAGETYNDNAEKVFTGLGIEYGSIMRIYYAVSEEAYNAGYVYKQAGHVISNPIEIVEGKNGKEYRLYLNIPPYEYFSGQTITVEDSEGNTICVYSCPMGRILLRFSNTEKYEEKVTSVARAAFDYCAALKAYLRSK